MSLSLTWIHDLEFRAPPLGNSLQIDRARVLTAARHMTSQADSGSRNAVDILVGDLDYTHTGMDAAVAWLGYYQLPKSSNAGINQPTPRKRAGSSSECRFTDPLVRPFACRRR